MSRKDAQISETMHRALDHMKRIEVDAAEHKTCPNVAVGAFVAPNTAAALVRRGLAEKCECRFSGDWAEIRLTDTGRA